MLVSAALLRSLLETDHVYCIVRPPEPVDPEASMVRSAQVETRGEKARTASGTKGEEGASTVVDCDTEVIGQLVQLAAVQAARSTSVEARVSVLPGSTVAEEPRLARRVDGVDQEQELEEEEGKDKARLQEKVPDSPPWLLCGRECTPRQWSEKEAGRAGHGYCISDRRVPLTCRRRRSR
jgi:hypothetical protein